jgi:hypothetical protein
MQDGMQHRQLHALPRSPPNTVTTLHVSLFAGNRQCVQFTPGFRYATQTDESEESEHAPCLSFS